MAGRVKQRHKMTRTETPVPVRTRCAARDRISFVPMFLIAEVLIQEFLAQTLYRHNNSIEFYLPRQKFISGLGYEKESVSSTLFPELTHNKP
jgi:hypothetical protein